MPGNLFSALSGALGPVVSQLTSAFGVSVIVSRDVATAELNEQNETVTAPAVVVIASASMTMVELTEEKVRRIYGDEPRITVSFLTSTTLDVQSQDIITVSDGPQTGNRYRVLRRAPIDLAGLAQHGATQLAEED